MFVWHQGRLGVMTSGWWHAGDGNTVWHTPQHLRCLGLDQSSRVRPSLINQSRQPSGPGRLGGQLWVTQVTSPGHHSGPHPPPDLSPPPPTVFISNQLRLPRLHKGFYQHPPSGVAVMNPLVVQVTIFKKFRKTKSLLPTCPILFLFVDWQVLFAR